MSDKPTPGVKIDICYFKVPVKIKESEEGNEATFEEVEMKERCFKLETKETDSQMEALNLAKEVSEKNNKTLRQAAKINKDGDLIIKVVVCKHGSVTVNPNM